MPTAQALGSGKCYVFVIRPTFPPSPLRISVLFIGPQWLSLEKKSLVTLAKISQDWWRKQEADKDTNTAESYMTLGLLHQSGPQPPLGAASLPPAPSIQLFFLGPVRPLSHSSTPPDLIWISLLPLGPIPQESGSASPLSPGRRPSFPGLIWQALQGSPEAVSAGKRGAHLRCLATGTTLPPPPLRAAGQRHTSPAGRWGSPRAPACCSLADCQVHLPANIPAVSSLGAPEAGLRALPFPFPYLSRVGKIGRNRRELLTPAPRRRAVMTSSRACLSARRPFPSCTRAWGEGSGLGARGGVAPGIEMVTLVRWRPRYPW